MKKEPARLYKKKENPLNGIPKSVYGFIIFVIIFIILIAIAAGETSYYNQQILYLL